MGVQLILLRIDDWQGLYKDEKLIRQDHAIPARDIADACMHQILDRFEVYDVSEKTLDAGDGDFPETLEGVILENGNTIDQERDLR